MMFPAIEQAAIILVGCLASIIWFIINILLCVWVYRDAESRGMNGVLWLIVVLIGGIVGLIVYLIVRKEKPPPPPPPRLGYSTESSLSRRFCLHCGKEVDADATFCPNCGGKL
ncbi:MAG: zinc ribbon domain-containing protein [Candidatus Bathyarchaeia archaeon]